MQAGPLSATAPFLTAEEENLLLRAARQSLTAWLEEGRVLLSMEGITKGALGLGHCAFVSLHRGPVLRGCVGYTKARGPLVKAVCESVVNAARDPRFYPVAREELNDISIEVSALTIGVPPDTPFVRVRSLSEIQVGRDGIHVRLNGDRGGLLLPQVAVRYGWEIEEFLCATCRKAGYEEFAWRNDAIEIYRFGAQVFCEDGAST